MSTPNIKNEIEIATHRSSFTRKDEELDCIEECAAHTHCMICKKYNINKVLKCRSSHCKLVEHDNRILILNVTYLNEDNNQIMNLIGEEDV